MAHRFGLAVAAAVLALCSGPSLASGHWPNGYVRTGGATYYASIESDVVPPFFAAPYDVYIVGDRARILFNRPCTVANGVSSFVVSCEALFRAGIIPGYNGWVATRRDYSAASIAVYPRAAVARRLRARRRAECDCR